jgi:hypothetical protein
MSVELPRPIQSYVRRFVTRGRRLAVVRAVGSGLLLACGWTVLACLLDWMLQLPAGARLGGLGVAVALLLGPLVRPLTELLGGRVDWVRAAGAIEQASPGFGQRLSTVVSQSLERIQYRGSTEMLERLAADVARQAADDRPARWLHWRPALRPWAALLALASAAALLGVAVPRLSAAVLLRRFVTPLAGVPPVTTTQIWIEPRGVTLLRGDALAVRARVQNLGDGPLEILITLDGQSWSRLPMTALSDSEFIFNFPAVDRDLRYCVAGGDARTNEYRVTVLRKPALAELRVRYDFPAYTGQPPLTTSITDGRIEAPVGTRLTLTLVSTEPLRQATFHTVGSKPEQLPLAPTSDPRVFQLEAVVRRSAIADLAMISVEGQSHRANRALSIRAQADREPIARILQPTGDLRLQPRDFLDIEYQFMDDYALSSAALAVQVNTRPATQVPLPLAPHARTQQGRHVLDLADLKVNVGDVVSVSAVAHDGAGRRVVRDTRQVLISPRSIDPATHQLIAELRQALQHAASLHDEVEAGAAAAEAARRPGSDPLPQRLKVTRSLGAAADAALLLHQSLLRAMPRTPPGQTPDALATNLDEARVALWSVARLATFDADGSREPAVAQGLKDLSQSVRRLAASLRILADGLQASAVLADRESLAPLQRGSISDRLRETLRRAEQDLAAAVEAIGLRPGEGNLHDRLQVRSDAAAQAVRAARVIDFEPAARQWAQAVASRQSIASPLAERLASASTAEALRPDTDPIRARDLQLASLAVARLASVPADHLESAIPAIQELASAVQAVQDEHRLRRDSPDAVDALRHHAVRDAAASARRRLAQWAELRFEWPPATAPATAPAPDQLALEASAEMTRGNLASARTLDQRLAAGTQALNELTRHVSAAEAIDRTSDDQKELARKTASARTEQEAAALEASQRRLAQAIPGAAAQPAADSRQQGLTVLERSREQLALLPRRLTAALASADALRQAEAMAQQSRRDAAAAPAARKPMAQRAAELAASAARDAQHRLSSDADHLAPTIAEQLLRDLRPYHPEAAEASQSVAERLAPALSAFQTALRSDGPSDVETAAQHVRSALEATQAHLAKARTRLLEKDPVVAARFYAHAAAQALAMRPPDFPGARNHQESALAALNRAWLEQLRAAGYTRLALAPGFRPLLRQGSADPATAQPAQGIVEMVPGVREWGFLPPRNPEASVGPAGEAEPKGYHEALRLYFEALNQVSAERHDAR